jgi:phage gpG-like protein
VALRLRFSFFADTQIDRTLDNFERAADMRPVWEALADRFLVLERRQFATEGRTGSAGWAPLSPAYAAWKARRYPGKTILRRTDELFRSLTEGPQVRIVDRVFMVIGSAVEHGRYHQAGGGNLPRRPPVELTEHERREWVRLVQRFLVTGDVPGIGPRGGITRPR